MTIASSLLSKPLNPWMMSVTIKFRTQMVMWNSVLSYSPFGHLLSRMLFAKKNQMLLHITIFDREIGKRKRERGTGWVSEKRAHVCCAIRHYLKYNMYTFFQHFSHVSIRSWLHSKWIHASIHTHLLCHLVALEQLTTENEPNK